MFNSQVYLQGRWQLFACIKKHLSFMMTGLSFKELHRNHKKIEESFIMTKAMGSLNIHSIFYKEE